MRQVQERIADISVLPGFISEVTVAADKLSRAQRAADATTEFSGSWKFVIGLALVTIFWILWNRGNLAFDPAPYLLLNWILTVVSTFQSPLIMMSQNRQITRDKLAAEAQAELDRQLVQGLHDKLDKLLARGGRYCLLEPLK